MESTSTSVFLVLTIIMSLNYVSFGQAVDRQKLREKSIPMLTECQKSVGASDEDVQAILNKKTPTMHEGQCLVECIFNNANMMKDGKLNKEGAIKTLSVLLDGDTAKQEKMKGMIELCEKEIGAGDGDKCTTAKMIADCIDKHGKEFGYELPTSK